ncbi:hypothetical protein [Gilvimarinus chinensis]|uniref:hypothetical protein n=1 Tax=Gilvimarinus chinensis TaxID=396005 RepID=UPI00036A3542|nr:hypothetical protein [Gilvimarinus chinensis]
MKATAWYLTGLLIALVGCGAERDEPFDPDLPVDDEGDSTAVRIDATKVIDGQQTLFDIEGEKQTHVFRDQEAYWLFLDRYTDLLPVNEPDFDEGQVVLVDLGEQEDSQCQDYLSLESVAAYESGDSGARLSLTYNLNEAVESNGCPDEEAELIRPYYFYYIATRRPMVVSESINE